MGAKLCLVFALVSLPVLVSPGPTVSLIVERTLAGGLRAGLALVAGLVCGAGILVAGVVFGVIALAQTAPPLLVDAIMALGGGYLIYLGVRGVAGVAWAAPALVARIAGGDELFRQGLMVNLFNARLVIFIAALIPLFYHARASDGASGELLLLGAVFLSMMAVIDASYVIASAAHRQARFLEVGALGWLRRGSGLVLALLGGVLVIRSVWLWIYSVALTAPLTPY